MIAFLGFTLKAISPPQTGGLNEGVHLNNHLGWTGNSAGLYQGLGVIFTC